MNARERFRISTFTNPSGDTVHRVSGTMPGGEQIRRNFREYKEAVGFKAELEIAALNHQECLGLKRTRLTDTQLADAEAAILKLEGTAQTLGDAVTYFLRHWKPSLVAKVVEDAYKEFLADKASQRLRKTSIQDLRYRVNRLVRAHAKRKVSEITVDDVKRLISIPGRSARTRNGDRRALHSFFAWCVQNDYRTENPVSKVDTAKVDAECPRILTLQEVKDLLREAKQYKNGIQLPYFVLSLFAGLRPAELTRVRWENIDLEAKTITLGGSQAKLRKRRIIELPDNIQSWLLPYVGAPIVPVNWRRDFGDVRRKAGFWNREKDGGDKDTLKEWTDDVLRHTAVSYHLAQHQHEGKTACWAGNSPDVVQRHYRGLVKSAEAAEFWTLTPECVEAPAATLLQIAA